MKQKPLLLAPVLAGGLVFFARLAGADDAVLPGTGFPASHYEVLWTKSPFAVATPEAGQESPDYALKGVAQFDGVSYASLIDKKSQEHFLLSTDKPARGLKLVSISHGKDPSDTVAVIEGNGQSITLKLDVTETPSAGPNVAATQAPNAPPPQIPMPGSTGPVGGINTTPANVVPPPVMIRPRLIHFPSSPPGMPPQVQPVPQQGLPPQQHQ